MEGNLHFNILHLFYTNAKILFRLFDKMLKIIVYFYLLLFLSLSAYACDLTQIDKQKHIEFSEKATITTKKYISYLFLPLYPIKWIFNNNIQKIFPDNYVPHGISAVAVFTLGCLKEMPYDFIGPGDCSYCDVVANCRGIRQGIMKNN